MLDNNTNQIFLKNRYRIIRYLGGGGFADTFLVHDIISNQNYAMKQLRNITNNLNLYKLAENYFHREAEILAKLNDSIHSIPTLYEFFAENDKWYLVQEWIDGEDLAQKINKEGCLSEQTTVNILINLLSTLAYIHSKRIIHRDIKPSNIMVRHEDNKPILIDFGAVKELISTAINPINNNLHNFSVIGTPGFMSLEQKQGKPTIMSDLYSLGITIICLLTGEPINKIVDFQTDSINRHIYVDKIDPKLVKIIDKAIRVEIVESYLTAQDMLDDVVNFFRPLSIASISDDKGTFLYKFSSQKVTIGREQCDISFNHDKMVSNYHCYIIREDKQFSLIDSNSRNGVFKKIKRQTFLNSGDTFLIGKQIIKIIVLMNEIQIQVIKNDIICKVYHINLQHNLQKVTIGRETCDVCLNDDMTISSCHCYMVRENGQLFLIDNDSHNGLFKKIEKQTTLESGDIFCIGKQLLHFKISG